MEVIKVGFIKRNYYRGIERACDHSNKTDVGTSEKSFFLLMLVLNLN